MLTAPLCSSSDSGRQAGPVDRRGRTADGFPARRGHASLSCSRQSPGSPSPPSSRPGPHLVNRTPLEGPRRPAEDGTRGTAFLRKGSGRAWRPAAPTSAAPPPAARVAFLGGSSRGRGRTACVRASSARLDVVPAAAVRRVSRPGAPPPRCAPRMLSRLSRSSSRTWRRSYCSRWNYGNPVLF